MGKPVAQLEGQRFHRLIVIKRDGSIKGRAAWQCLCDCGNTIRTHTDLLKNDKVKSCGCLKVDVAKARIEDFTGIRFGRLVAQELFSTGIKGTKWKCLCDCGKEKIVRASQLKEGSILSCGCLCRDLLTGDAKSKPDFTPLPKRKLGVKKGRRSRKGEGLHDLSGQKFGRLTVKTLVKTSPTVWLCDCDCGKQDIEIRAGHLKNKNTQSCGCLNRDRVSEANFKHGKTKTPEYMTWVSMYSRCYNPNDEAYKNYGGRGIKICQRWIDNFEDFLEDMGPRPEGCSLDRIDVNGDYCPENCRWADRITQARNTRRKKIEYKGEELLPVEWAERFGVKRQWFANRYYHMRMSMKEIEEAANNPDEKHKIRAERMTPEHKEKREARMALSNAIRWKKISKPEHCQHPDCKNTNIQGHHHKGYEKEFALDVIWLCPEHHPREGEKMITIDGVEMRIRECCKKYNIKRSSLLARLAKGWTPEDAAKTPLRERLTKHKTRKTRKSRLSENTPE